MLQFGDFARQGVHLVALEPHAALEQEIFHESPHHRVLHVGFLASMFGERGQQLP